MSLTRLSPQTPFPVSLLLLAWIAVAGTARTALAGPALSSSNPDYVQRVWTTQDGLPQNVIRALAQTRDGYLWIGTGNGLVRFDGVTFTVFSVTDTSALPSNWIASLYEDARGSLWIGTDAGLAEYRDGTFTTHVLPKGSVDSIVRAFAQDRRGDLWVVTSRQLLRRGGTGWTLVPLGDARPTSFLIDATDTLWIGTDDGLLQWRDRIVRTFTTRDGLPSGWIRSLREDSRHQLWIGTSRGLVRLDRITGRLQREPGPLHDAGIVQMFTAPDGTLWIGSTTALYMRTAEGHVSTFPIAVERDAAQVRTLMQDREGHLWFGIEGGAGGLHRLSRRQVRVVSHEDGLPCDNIGPVIEGPDRTIWAGALCRDGGGLVALRGGRITSHIAPRGRAVSQISALATEPDGSLWLGTHQGTLARFANGQFTRHEDPASGLSGAVAALYRDASGALWIGSQGGLTRYHAGQWRTWRVADGLVSDDVRTIVSGRDGSLWIGTGGGLSRFVDNRFTSHTPKQGFPRGPVGAIHVDADGTVWAGTYGGGLCRLKDGRLTRYGTQGGLLDSAVHRILDDEAGSFWLSGDTGIVRVSRRDLDDVADGRRAHVAASRYDQRDGMENAACNGMGQPAGWRMHDGTIWFPTRGGLVQIDPRHVVREEGALPTPVIEAVRVNHTTHAGGGSLTIAPGAEEIEFRFTAPSFVRAAQIQFRYRLIGQDTDWIDSGTRRVAHYTNLAPGSYQFQVQARGSAGSWTNGEPQLAILLQPHLYQRLGVRLALAALGLLGLAAGVRLRNERLRRRARALEETVVQRTAELLGEREEAEVANRQLNDANEQLGAAYQQLDAAKTALERSHTQLLSVYDQLRVGVILVNARYDVLFVSGATCRLIGARQEDIVGRPLAKVLATDAETIAGIEKQLVVPQPGMRVIAKVQPAQGSGYWTEIEVCVDPRDGRNRLLYLYDVTEMYELKRSRESDAPAGPLSRLLGSSIVMRALRQQVATLAAVDATVLIEGETGTGKEVTARALHAASRRSGRPFVAINCGGLTESLLASQLFGHRRGAFTGAVSDHVGQFEAAQGGTLLLDEIGDMPMAIQTHLLRVLQEREILRVGDSKPRPIDVRVIAATHRCLEQCVRAGTFREDLLYRIRVVRIALPSLRQRADDIPILATAFVRELSAAHGKVLDGISRPAMEHLLRHRWPGNIRELRGTIEEAVVRASGPVVKVTDLPSDLVAEPPQALPATSESEERALLIETLRRTGGNRTVAARLLGVSRATLYRRLAVLDSLPVAGADETTGSQGPVIPHEE